MAPPDPIQPTITGILCGILAIIIRLWDGRKGTPLDRVERLEGQYEKIKRANHIRNAEINDIIDDHEIRIRRVEREAEISA